MVPDSKKTKSQLIAELEATRRRLETLEKRPAKERRSNYLLRIFIDALPNFGFAFDGHDRISQVLTGNRTSETRVLEGRLLADILPQKDAEELGKWLLRTFDTGEAQYFESILSVLAGRRWFQVRTFLVRDQNRGEEFVVFVFQDITNEKLTESVLEYAQLELREKVTALRKSEEKLLEAQERSLRREKLAVLGQLAAGVSHELRNPLGAIKNAAYFLSMALEKPEPEVKEMLAVLNEEVTTSERIIENLLEFARPNLPTRHTVDINDLVQRALDRASLPGTIETVTRLDEALPPILADPNQVSHIFGNIILNAIQAMPDGGQLDVKSEASTGDWVAVSFSDTGVGIPEENLAKLFEPLFTTKAGGIGLGLALTKTLVEQQGGTIEVKSEVGKGSTFTVRLPAESKEQNIHGRESPHPDC